MFWGDVRREHIGSGFRVIDVDKCDGCGTCLMLGCQAIQKQDGQVYIDAALCAGDACTICEQVCPKKAISPISTAATKELK